MTTTTTTKRAREEMRCALTKGCEGRECDMTRKAVSHTMSAVACSRCFKYSHTCRRCSSFVDTTARNEFDCIECTRCRTLLSVPPEITCGCESCGSERPLKWFHDNAYRCTYCSHVTEICKGCGAPSEHFETCGDSSMCCKKCGMQTRGVEMIHGHTFEEFEESTKFFGARDAAPAQPKRSYEGAEVVWRSQNDSYISSFYSTPKRALFTQLAKVTNEHFISFGKGFPEGEARELARKMDDPEMFDRISGDVDEALKRLYMCDQLSGSSAVVAVAAAVTFANARTRALGMGGIVKSALGTMNDEQIAAAAAAVVGAADKTERDELDKNIIRLVRRLIVISPRISKPSFPLFTPNMAEPFPLDGFVDNTVEAAPVAQALRCMCTYLPSVNKDMTNRDIFASHVMTIYTMCSRFRVFRDDNDIFNNMFMCIHAAASTERYGLKVNTLSSSMNVLDAWRDVVYGKDSSKHVIAAIVNCMSIIAFGNLQPRHATSITPALAAVAPIVSLARTDGKALAAADPRLLSAAAAHVSIEKIFKETAKGVYDFCFPAAAARKQVESELHKALDSHAELPALLRKELVLTCQLRLQPLPTAQDLAQEARLYKA